MSNPNRVTLDDVQKQFLKSQEDYEMEMEELSEEGEDNTNEVLRT